MPKKATPINSKTQERLRLLIAQHADTQQAFADMVGLSLNSISAILTGDRGMTSDAAARICAAFPDVQMSWLLGASDNIESDHDASKNAEQMCVRYIDEAFKACLLSQGLRLEYKSADIKNENGNVCRGKICIKNNAGEIIKVISQEQEMAILAEIENFCKFKISELLRGI